MSPAIETAGGRDQAGQAEQDGPLAADVDPEVGGGLLAEQEPVERAGPGEDGDRGQQDDRRRQRELEPRGALEAAEQEEEDLAEVRPRQVHRHRQPGGEERADGVAGEEQARQRGERPGPAEAVDRDDRDQRPDEREQLDQPELEDDDPDRDEDRDRRAEGGSGGGPQHVRVRQRVAQEPLEGDAGHRQAQPDDHRREDPRQAEVHDDRLGRRRPGAAELEPEEPVGEDRDRLRRGDRDGAQADAQDEHDDEGDQAARRGAATVGPGRARASQDRRGAAQDLAAGGHGQGVAEPDGAAVASPTDRATPPEDRGELGVDGDAPGRAGPSTSRGPGRVTRVSFAGPDRAAP